MTFGKRFTTSGGNPARRDPTFQNRTYDEGLGIYDYRNRSFDPATGRFLQRDPVLGGDSLYNPYVFPGNNPVGNLDPMGLDYIDEEDGKIYWVIEEDATIDWDKRRIEIGTKAHGDYVNLYAGWGGSMGTFGVHIRQLEAQAADIWNFAPKLWKKSESEQDAAVKQALRRATVDTRGWSATPGIDKGEAAARGALKVIAEPVLLVADISGQTYGAIAGIDDIPLVSMLGKTQKARLDEGQSLGMTITKGVAEVPANVFTLGNYGTIKGEVMLVMAYERGDITLDQLNKGMGEIAGAQGAVVVMASYARARSGAWSKGSGKAGKGGSGAASKVRNLQGMTERQAAHVLRKAGFTGGKKSGGGWRVFKHPDGSKVHLGSDGRIVRTPAPKYGPTGARINKGARLGPDGSNVPRSLPHDQIPAETLAPEGTVPVTRTTEDEH